MKVLNKRDIGRYTQNMVYIGRGGPYGNPFRIGQHGSREQVIAQYRDWAKWNIGKEELEALKGKDLVCWCAPQACHGDVLIEMVKELG